MYYSKIPWKRYKKILWQFLDHDSARTKVIYRRSVVNPIPGWSEDEVREFDEFELDGLFHYNTFRIWPINENTPSGELDKMNGALFLSNKHLLEKGLLDSNGYFRINGPIDRFIIKGITYLAKGDTDVSQANSDPIEIDTSDGVQVAPDEIMIQLLLRREDQQWRT